MSDRDDDPISTALSLEPIGRYEIAVEDAPSDNTESYDMETARQNMHHLIQKGNHALDEALNVAIQSQAVDAFEVTAKLLKVMAGLNRDLIDLQQKKKYLAIKDDEIKNGPAPDTVNNTLVVTTSTSELQDMLARIGKK